MKLFLTINIHYFIHFSTSLIYESVNTLKILFLDIFNQMCNITYLGLIEKYFLWKITFMLA